MTQSELRELKAIGAELGAAKAENEKLRQALKAIDRRNDNPARFDSEIDKIVRAALSQQDEPVEPAPAQDEREAPIASHLLYTQPGVLNDDVPEERAQGIDAGLAWRAVAHASVVYTDRGISKGMEYGIAAAQAAGVPIEYRTLNGAA